MLVARARGTRISFRFSELQKIDPADPNPPPREDPTVSQRCIKGNVLIMPQNTTRLHALIPPTPASIRDTVCTVFVGRTRPTASTIGKLGPVLVRKSRVKTIATFLCRDNPYYAPDHTFKGFSQHNLDIMFGEESQDQDEGVPCAMDIGFLEAEEALDAPNTDPANPRMEEQELGDVDSILMENVGYTCGDDSPVAYRDMKLQAISHCLNNGRFIRSRAGDRFVPDFENPSLLTWMFPHLDPWGIGGFHHPGRRIPVTMQEQLTYLLQIHDSPFEKDPDFAFVYYNILQKKAVCDSVKFKVKAAHQREIVQRILNIDRSLLESLIRAYERNKQYVPQTIEERELLDTVNRVSTVTRDLPGTTGYKIRMRNEIR
ncbi:hypothetical protein C8Q76DRAFT_636846, partial [Earliella scabrosa]